MLEGWTRIQRLEMESVTETDMAPWTASERSETKESTIRGPKATPKMVVIGRAGIQRHDKVCIFYGYLWLSALLHRVLFNQTSQGEAAQQHLPIIDFFWQRSPFPLFFPPAPPHLERHRLWRSSLVSQTSHHCINVSPQETKNDYTRPL